MTIVVCVLDKGLCAQKYLERKESAYQSPDDCPFCERITVHPTGRIERGAQDAIQ